jgi:hypothetical protein
MKPFVAFVGAAVVGLFVAGCGTPYDDPRCDEIAAKLEACDPGATQPFSCSAAALDRYDLIMAMDCGGGKADGGGEGLMEIRSAALQEKGYLDLQDLEDMFHATGIFYSHAEDEFMWDLAKDLLLGYVSYQHEPFREQISVDGVFGTSEINVPLPGGDGPDGYRGAETVRRFIHVSSPVGPRW